MIIRDLGRRPARPALRGFGAFGAFGDVSPPAGAFMTAHEGEAIQMPGPATIWYGTPGRQVLPKSVGPGTACSNATWGTDPVPGTRKACYAVAPFATAPQGSKVAAENGGFSTPGPSRIFFGAGSNWRVQDVGAGQFTCNNSSFGPDPWPGVVKSCYAQALAAPPPAPAPAPAAPAPAAPAAPDPSAAITALGALAVYQGIADDLKRAATAAQSTGAGQATYAAYNKTLADAKSADPAAVAYNSAATAKDLAAATAATNQLKSIAGTVKSDADATVAALAQDQAATAQASADATTARKDAATRARAIWATAQTDYARAQQAAARHSDATATALAAQAKAVLDQVQAQASIAVQAAGMSLNGFGRFSRFGDLTADAQNAAATAAALGSQLTTLANQAEAADAAAAQAQASRDAAANVASSGGSGVTSSSGSTSGGAAAAPILPRSSSSSATQAGVLPGVPTGSGSNTLLIAGAVVVAAALFLRR